MGKLIELRSLKNYFEIFWRKEDERERKRNIYYYL